MHVKICSNISKCFTFDTLFLFFRQSQYPSTASYMSPYFPSLILCCTCIFVKVYTLLGQHYQLPDATPEQIKKAYYNCMKACHPDLSGNDPDTTNFCMFINDVYEVRCHLAMKCLEICVRKHVFSFLCFFGNWTMAV